MERAQTTLGVWAVIKGCMECAQTNIGCSGVMGFMELAQSIIGCGG